MLLQNETDTWNCFIYAPIEFENYFKSYEARSTRTKAKLYFYSFLFICFCICDKYNA